MIMKKMYVWQEGQWCPGGLTKSQKRRVQRLRNTKQQEAKKKPKVWQVKQTVNEGKNKPSAMIGVTFMLPAKFRAADQEIESDDEDETVVR